MPTAREFMSPPGQGSLSRLPSTPLGPQYISPSTRRQVGLTSPVSALPCVTQNDDEAERTARRRSKVLEIQRNTLSSPATPTDRRRSAPLSGLSNVQLTEHYANCIKLSAENKINAKNAFGLHLIDYMAELLKKKDMASFQVASSTLDASAKIYAGRVDAIHSETYKVLTGLGRSAANQNKGDEDQVVEEEEVAGQKKRTRTRKANTVEANIKSLNVNKFDLEFEVDPLFQKTSAAFDEGGTSGLLLGSLRCLDDTCQLVLDSNTVVQTEEDVCVSQDKEHTLVDLTDLKEVYQGVNFDSLQICPAFADFEFTNWSKDGQDGFSSMLQSLAKSDHAFDLDAEVEPISQDDQLDDVATDGADAFCGNASGDSFADDDHCTGTEGGVEDKSELEFLADGSEAKLVQNTLNNIKHGTIGTLMQVLAAEPGEYSYFNSNLLRTWAGPSHWKLRSQAKDARNNLSVANKTRKEKPTFRLDYEEERNFDELFKETRAATTLTKGTLQKYSKSQTTLPEDLHYDADKLFRLFIKPKLMVKRQDTTTNDLDDEVDNYDYDNANDRDNYCPALEAIDDDDDDDNHGGTGFNISAAPSEFSQSHISQGSFLADNTQINATLLQGDNLVSLPHKVNKIDIGYAKTAKKMDVKRLKAVMWDLLTREENKENQMDNEPVLEKEECKAVTFQSVLEQLPSKLSRNMSSNLSVPIAFVCLLHLANEKTLKIDSLPDMSNLEIKQGV